MATNNSTLDEFPGSQKLPTEVRLMIWNMALVPRRVDLTRGVKQPRLDRSVEALRQVNFEARQAFLDSYTRCFDSDGHGIFLNFEIDTLCVNTEGLLILIEEYPSTMCLAQWIDIESDRDPIHDYHDADVHPVGGYITAKENGSLELEDLVDLSCLSSVKLITVHWCLDGSMIGDMWGMNTFYEARWEEESISLFEYLKMCFLSNPESDKTSNYPTIACVLPSSNDWVEEFYLESSGRLDHVSYGKVVRKSARDLFQGFEVNWIEQGIPFEPQTYLEVRVQVSDAYGVQCVMYTDDVFHKIFLRRTTIDSFRPIEPQLKLKLEAGTITTCDMAQYLEFDKKAVAYLDERPSIITGLGKIEKYDSSRFIALREDVQRGHKIPKIAQGFVTPIPDQGDETATTSTSTSTSTY